MIDTQTDTHTDAGNDDTRRPKLASGKKKQSHCFENLWALKIFNNFVIRVQVKHRFMARVPSYHIHPKPELFSSGDWHMFMQTYRQYKCTQNTMSNHRITWTGIGFWIDDILLIFNGVNQFRNQFQLWLWQLSLRVKYQNSIIMERVKAVFISASINLVHYCTCMIIQDCHTAGC